MKFDPSSATLTEDAKPAKAKFDPSTATPVDATPTTSEKEEPRLLDRISRVGREALTGGIYGTVAPEMMMAAGGAIKPLSALPGIPGRAAGGISTALTAGGEAMKVARPASAAAGVIGGAMGETAGQVVESKYGPGIGAETARLLSATLGPVPIQYLGTKTGGLLGTLAGKFMPGMSTAKTVGQLLQESNTKPQNLTKEQEAFIARKLEDIRGGQSSLDAQKEIMDMLKAGVGKITQAAELNASQLEQRAANQSQQIITSAQATAKRIRDNARLQSPSVRQIAEVEANAALQKGQAEAQRIQTESRKQIADLRKGAGKLTTRAEAGVTEAQKSLSAVGAPQTPTTIGTKIRETVNPIFVDLKKTRSDNAETNKGEAFSFAFQKEKAGQKVSDTKAFEKAISDIDTAITNPETKLTNVTINEVKSQLDKVKRALDPRVVDEQTGVVTGTPVSFQGLENLRRFLRDRSYGLPAEGFDSIGQIQAGKLADSVEAIQREFSPSITKFLEQYRKDSDPLRVFKTKLGESIVGKEEFDMARFTTDPATIGDKFFKSETGVKDLITLLGNNAGQAESIARAYVADKLRNATGKQVKEFVETSSARDWLDTFPALKNQLTTAAQTMTRAEGFGGARSKLADALRTQAGGVETLLPKQTEKVLTEAQKTATKLEEQRIKDAAKALKLQKKTASGVVSEAEAAAQAQGKPLTEAAKTMRAEAQKYADTILGGTTDAKRVKDIILSSDKDVWEETSRIILSTPGGKEKFGDAVGQVIADRATSSFKGALQDWKYIGDNLTTYGLMSPKQVSEIESKLSEVFLAPVDLRQKITMAQRLLRNAVAGYVAPAITRAIE